MAVIAVLVAVAIPTFTNQLEKSRQAVDVSNLRGAYAAARLAEVDQAVNSETFKVIYNSTTTPSADNLKFWYNPDTGNLTRIASTSETAASIEGASAQYGKATQAKVVADVSQLANVCRAYYNNVNNALTNAGTLDKCILVTYKLKTGSSLQFVIDKIAFVTSADKSADLLAVNTLLPSSESVAIATYTSGSSKVTDATDGTNALTVSFNASDVTTDVKYSLKETSDVYAIDTDSGVISTKSGATANPGDEISVMLTYTSPSDGKDYRADIVITITAVGP